MRQWALLIAIQLLLAIYPVASVAASTTDAPATAAGKNHTQSAREGWTALIYFENDLFYNEDRYYTNAVQARIISPDLKKFSDNTVLHERLGQIFEAIPLPGRGAAEQYNISIGLGQQIYTPEDTEIRYLQEDDRPYAGYLYGSLALHAKRHDSLDTLELTAGVVGPSARAEQAQNEVHRFRGFDTAKGWNHQLKDEPALMLSWSHIWRLNPTVENTGWDWDFLPHVVLTAGTPVTQASAGGELRFGWNPPPDFGSATIQPGSGIIAPSTKQKEQRESFWQKANAQQRANEAQIGNTSVMNLDEANNGAKQSESMQASQDTQPNFWRDNLSLYMFIGATGKAVAYNTFLDGNLWHSSHSVDKFPFVGELHWGIGCSIYDFTITYTHVLRSKEFHGQDKGQNFGSITVGYTF